MAESTKDKQPSDEDRVENVAHRRLLDVVPDYGRPWYRVPHLLKLNVSLLVLLVASYMSGYDGSMLNGMQSVPVWKKDFDNPSGSILGLLSTMQVIGNVAGLPIAPVMADRLGRRHPIAIGSVLMLLGTAIQSGANGIGMFLAGRAIIGVGGTLVSVSAAPLLAELAFPTHRPILTSVYNTSWYLGSIVAAWVTYGTFKIPNSWSWRIPSILQALPSLIQLAFIYLLPESPRWLVAQDRPEDAMRVLARAHAGSDDPSELVERELAEIEAAIQEEKIQNTASYLDFTKTRGNLHRLFICISLGFIIQWCGNGLVSYYLVQVLNNIGITDAKTQNIINGVLQIFNWLVAVTAAFTVDRLGRRLLFLVSTAGMCVAFVVWTAISARNEQQHYENKGLGIGIVAMIFLFYLFYNVAMSPLPIAYLMEALPFTLRAKGLTLFNLAQFSTVVFNGFVNPVALEAIGWRYYIVFLCLVFVWFVVIFFFYPETRGLSLEEVTVVFDKREVLEASPRKVNQDHLV
ncbi:hypothetical protein VTK73DRAFT_8083 [Phialemonium thermophilum]|uniref:Major facilitator superfamily (MFS) profile domain-containing protein n=1 Tax=Phialemonium thermophilum TaxID=223376 RepID=A0ABR3WBC0_9PEZI